LKEFSKGVYLPIKGEIRMIQDTLKAIEVTGTITA
jgi:hypothetical protein